MKQGLVDSRTQRFRQGDQEMSLDDALHIIPAKGSGAGPTIEEVLIGYIVISQ